MNLQALYDLKERLEYVAIAGTGLLREDFRLRRAVDALAPLAAASQVFAKISAAAKELLAAPQEQLSTRLLDVLSLVDAVVYTQGVTSVPGEWTPMEPGAGKYVQIPYGLLQPLITALSGTGNGKTALIREYWTNHPEYFGDFRVLPYVVGALKDHYAELTDLIEQILAAQGKGIVPLLKAGFDPDGKMEMARRVRLIAKLAGEDENEWFVEMLPASKKDVREAIIQVLGLSQGNAPLLLDLCRSERGKLKETALRSMAMMEDDVCIDFWKAEASRKPGLVACLKGVGGTLAADLTADALQSWLEQRLVDSRPYSQEELEQVTKLTAAACGKDSMRMRDFWRWTAERMDAFHEIKPAKSVRFCDLSLAEQLQKALMQTVLSRPSTECLMMAKDLGERHREWFLGCAFLADLTVLSPEEQFDIYSPYMVKTSPVRPEWESEANERIQIMRALGAVCWSSERKCYCVEFPRWDILSNRSVSDGWNLKELDRRWISLLADPSVREDGGIFHMNALEPYDRICAAKMWLLQNLLNEDDPQVCAVIGSWLYNWTLETGRIQESIDSLIRCGWKNWDGLLVKCFQKRGQISYSVTTTVLGKIPLTNRERAEQLRQVDALARENTLKIQYRQWPYEIIQRQIAMLENDPNAEL